MRNVIMTVAVVGLLASGSALAQTTSTPAAAPAPTSPAASADPDYNTTMVCKTMEPATGTRLGARHECHTQREWDQIRTNNQAALQANQTEGLQHNPPGN